MKAADGTPDSIEVYSLSQDELLDLQPAREHPQPVRDNQAACRQFIETARHAVRLVLGQLDISLGLPPGTLASLSSVTAKSDTNLRMIVNHACEAIRAPDTCLFPGHTDVGLITLLFNVVGGLQVSFAGPEDKEMQWQYIEPKPGCVIVNIGDTLVELTGGVLRSALHRAVTPPGSQSSVPRVSIAYLIRPALTQSMEQLLGEGDAIPRQGNGDTTPLDFEQWSQVRLMRIMRGELSPRTIGGTALPTYVKT